MNNNFDIESTLSSDKPGVRTLNSTSQLQKEIGRCVAGQITPEAFYMNVGFELALVSSEDWDYLQKNECIASNDMIVKLLMEIDKWKVVDLSDLWGVVSSPSE